MEFKISWLAFRIKKIFYQESYQSKQTLLQKAGIHLTDSIRRFGCTAISVHGKVFHFCVSMATGRPYGTC